MFSFFAIFFISQIGDKIQIGANEKTLSVNASSFGSNPLRSVALPLIFPIIELLYTGGQTLEMEETAIPPPLAADLLAMVAFIVVNLIVRLLEIPKY